MLDTGGVGRIKKMMPKATKVGTDGHGYRAPDRTTRRPRHWRGTSNRSIDSSSEMGVQTVHTFTVGD
ncbi:MAG: hypothetical protein DMG12_11950, partial [Acidobacteria bacterium]